MRHEQLWAPWRLTYIQGDASGATQPGSELKLLPGADPQCFICRGLAESTDRKNLIVERTEHGVVILNRFPYNNGHLLVAPLLHKGRLNELTNHEHLALQQLITKYIGVLQKLVNAEGFNIGLNLGRIAGAGLPGHLHWHIVPRWSGDTNFMPAVSGVKVIPQSLDALWEALEQARSQADTAGEQ